MVKAEEYMGLIKEKELIYVDAANHYEKGTKFVASPESLPKKQLS
jgi:hypothetical protein